MDPARIRRLLDRFRKGDIGLEEVLTVLSVLPYEDIGEAKIDHHRPLRRGVPEIIFGEGKSAEQVVRIAGRMRAAGSTVIASRLSAEALAAIHERLPLARIHEVARLAVVGPRRRLRKSGTVVCCAGTTDIPVAGISRSRNRPTRPLYRPPPMTEPSFFTFGITVSNTGPV